MYLKQIIAHGFKSFADKTILEFHPGITGIVGPNGSGKSNVVDAVRWVLGEQSIKSLRGDDKMTDVIFSGSKSRKAMNVASVTLIFDNQDHYLNVPYDEVSITRRVYKDGSNEYLLNQERCRLKDISEVLLDTGVAKESFNIISQGKIEEILSSKKIRLYCFRNWHKSVVRRASFLDKTVAYPVTLLQDHDDTRIGISEELAD